jgi:hypothetical protein
MPDAIVVNVPPYTGEYEFDLAMQPLSTVEWRWVKKISGYLPLTITEGWEGGDPDLFLAFAICAMRRAGRITKAEVYEVAEIIEEAAVDGVAISFKGEVAEEEDEADPTIEPEPEDSKPDSGESSETPTEPSPESTTPKASGIQDWATGSDSDRLTLAR